MASLRSVPAHSLDAALDFIRQGGRLAIPTAYRVTILDGKALARFERAGAWMLKEDGDGYRMRTGRSSVYLVSGQLSYVIES